LELAYAEERTNMAENLVTNQNEIDNLSNFFLECVYAQRKSLRQRLVKMKFANTAEDDPK
jgi:hypothetical protein